ncbi:MAG: hypothetical protein FWD15_00380 [Alphaproteobacteria bacterium]|nr:hypothetical protein [Alphaproteobacteria bacterium]
MKVFLAILLFLSACGSIREYSNKELTLEYEVVVPDKSKNQIYAHTSLWLIGSADAYKLTNPTIKSQSQGIMSQTIVVDKNISPANNDFVKFNLTFIIIDEHAKLVFSNPRLESKSWLFPMDWSKINMEKELAGYKQITEQMFEEYSEYIIDAPINPHFEKNVRVITESTTESEL